MLQGISYPYGKQEIKDFLKSTLQPGDKICDMGPGCGTYYNLLGKEYEWTGVEIWAPTAQELTAIYDYIYQQDIRNFKYDKNYDLVIFGDVIEHLTVEDAQKCIAEAKEHSKAIMIAVPYCYTQGVLYGNAAEIHIQDDLTHDLFNERYPGFKVIYRRKEYGYYYWSKA